MTAQGHETGDSVSELTGMVVGAPATSWLDAGLLDGLLAAIDAPQVALGLGALDEPCLVRPAGQDDHLALVMPCQPMVGGTPARDEADAEPAAPGEPVCSGQAASSSGGSSGAARSTELMTGLTQCASDGTRAGWPAKAGAEAGRRAEPCPASAL